MKKSETREFLEKEFEKMRDFSPASALDEQSPEEEEKEELLDEYLNAPLSFKAEFAESFKSLPPEMRKYLHERESEVEKGFSKLGNEVQMKRFFDGLFETKGSKHGFKDCKEWIEKLVMVEDLLDNSPKDTLEFLATAYGIDLGAQTRTTTPKAPLDVNGLKIAMISKEMETLKEEFAMREKKYAEFMANARAAQKAKEASFYPKGRSQSQGMDFENMTTRQILEKKFAELED